VAGEVHHHKERVLGDRSAPHALHVRHGDPAGARGSHVDVVHAGAGLRDQPQGRCERDHRFGHGCVGGQDAVGLGQQRLEIVEREAGWDHHVVLRTCPTIAESEFGRHEQRIDHEQSGHVVLQVGAWDRRARSRGADTLRHRT
jgi:hypothetical protein